MRLFQVHFRLSIEHPALGGQSRSRERFRAKGCHGLGKEEETFEIEIVGPAIKLTCAGKTRYVNLNQAIWWDELKVKPAQRVEVEPKGKPAQRVEVEPKG